MNPIFAFGKMLLDVAYPPSCPACGMDVAADGNFCAECFSKLRLISAPLCDCCGIPFAIPVEAGTCCPECLEEPPSFSHCRAAMVYDAISAPLVSALKFSDHWAGLSRHVAVMCSAGGSVLTEAEVIIPVPLHWRRLLARRYNQSALLAYGLAQQTGLACRVDVLKRVRYTRPQMRLDRATRKRNVAKAFGVEHAAAIADKTVLLVDDVVTTGATAEACAKALLKAGAKEVRVLSLARTVKE